MGQAVSIFLSLYFSKQDRKMRSLQRILHVHTKRQIPICLEVAFGPKPQGPWSACGCSDELLGRPVSPRQGGGQPHSAEPQSQPRLCSLGPAASGRPPTRGAGGSAKLTSAALATVIYVPTAKACSASPMSRAGLWWSVCVC